jgi:hypothetical protein
MDRRQDAALKTPFVPQGKAALHLHLIQRLSGGVVQSFRGGSSTRNSLTERKSKFFASLRMTDRDWTIR